MKYLKEVLKLLYILSFVLLILIYPTHPILLAEPIRWTEVSSNSDGIQFIDTESIKYKKGILSIMTKYTEVSGENHEVINSSSYEMEIDCERRLFKKESGKNWELPSGKLMKQLLIKSCTY